ncbi:MAG: hypothetical protein EOP45_17900 [Sphingobacteriaceae bacterium]|nr:MAG: hypothetical protein EOP45_17900 [Sphingobacteriaceae bacterium]
MRAERIASGTASQLGSRLIENSIINSRKRIAALPDGPDKSSQKYYCQELERSIEGMDFPFDTNSADSPTGLIYAVTSPILNAVKIGQWSGSVDQLRSRYRTYYGHSCHIVYQKVADRRICEIQTFQQFSSFNLRSVDVKNGELFDKRYLKEYNSFIKALR